MQDQCNITNQPINRNPKKRRLFPATSVELMTLNIGDAQFQIPTSLAENPIFTNLMNAIGAMHRQQIENLSNEITKLEKESSQNKFVALQTIHEKHQTKLELEELKKRHSSLVFEYDTLVNNSKNSERGLKKKIERLNRKYKSEMQEPNNLKSEIALLKKNMEELSSKYLSLHKEAEEFKTKLQETKNYAAQLTMQAVQEEELIKIQRERLLALTKEQNSLWQEKMNLKSDLELLLSKTSGSHQSILEFICADPKPDAKPPYEKTKKQEEAKVSFKKIKIEAFKKIKKANQSPNSDTETDSDEKSISVPITKFNWEDSDSELLIQNSSIFSRDDPKSKQYINEPINPSL